ncbi:hypothetical protein CONCODRAFT_16504 [Conidiobolus coronatus NRRL 28638]|uniref:Uncharacterized protein n=1 Tax=Conidiobolus coronatus (strain ATCC 28846 / CBS 209.66 / NRRL 28638) TaxID=796925 RepID=A0A137PAI1_CONC2|nr:hypothetical protein CONCODRAFT_16504 [Conidiobolus coronatus NRRL 28638]|eukprot:KXN72007.1 hypothetical protein CONCODRAFT_16504 [Conidiobolus coronatus NRRL 28638]
MKFYLLQLLAKNKKVQALKLQPLHIPLNLTILLPLLPLHLLVTPTPLLLTESSTTTSSGASTQTQPSYPDVNTPQTAILAFANGANDGRKNVQNGATETLINARNLGYYLAISTFIYYLL